MNKKILYLFIALLLPVLIFLFLKYFGKNEFDIPVYYEKGVDSAPAECKPTEKKGQYFVADTKLKWAWLDGYAAIVSFAPDKETNELKELIAEEKFEKIQLISMSVSENELKNCVLFLKDPWNVVLIDNQKRIRGYYKIGDRDEMDRIEVELKILLKKY